MARIQSCEDLHAGQVARHEGTEVYIAFGEGSGPSRLLVNFSNAIEEELT